jgi:putative addiction module killer protein
MYEIRTTDKWARWFDRLRDRQAQGKIEARIIRMRDGHLGDHRYLQDGLYEVRIFGGPGYRIYFAFEGRTIILLLVGGDKGSQDRDIGTAYRLMTDLGIGRRTP